MNAISKKQLLKELCNACNGLGLVNWVEFFKINFNNFSIAELQLYIHLFKVKE